MYLLFDYICCVKLKKYKIMKKLSVLLIFTLLISCDATETKTDPQALVDNSVERVVNNGSFDTYKVKVGTMEFIVFRGVECISSIRVK